MLSHPRSTWSFGCSFGRMVDRLTASSIVPLSNAPPSRRAGHPSLPDRRLSPGDRLRHGSFRSVPRGVGTLSTVSFTREFRRHAHRTAKLPRSTWRRVYTYRRGPHGVYIPLSSDAPYSDEDAHFWDWTAVVILLLIVAGFAVWGVSALA